MCNFKVLITPLSDFTSFVLVSPLWSLRGIPEKGGLQVLPEIRSISAAPNFSIADRILAILRLCFLWWCLLVPVYNVLSSFKTTFYFTLYHLILCTLIRMREKCEKPAVFQGINKKKNPETNVDSVFLWSCWADPNCRPHPYRPTRQLFSGCLFVSFKVLWFLVMWAPKGFLILFTVRWCWLILFCFGTDAGRFDGKQFETSYPFGKVKESIDYSFIDFRLLINYASWFAKYKYILSP